LSTELPDVKTFAKPAGRTHFPVDTGVTSSDGGNIATLCFQVC
jgi:hypothetical protein